MDIEMLQHIDHIHSDTGNRLLGLTMLCGKFEKDWISEQQVYLLHLRMAEPYPYQQGKN